MKKHLVLSLFILSMLSVNGLVASPTPSIPGGSAIPDVPEPAGTILEELTRETARLNQVFEIDRIKYVISKPYLSDMVALNFTVIGSTVARAPAGNQYLVIPYVAKLNPKRGNAAILTILKLRNPHGMLIDPDAEAMKELKQVSVKLVPGLPTKLTAVFVVPSKCDPAQYKLIVKTELGQTVVELKE